MQCLSKEDLLLLQVQGSKVSESHKLKTIKALVSDFAQSVASLNNVVLAAQQAESLEQTLNHFRPGAMHQWFKQSFNFI